ncbi:MAG: hypothetical protein DI598_21065, partial [Pseudopedobacter saltans]
MAVEAEKVTEKLTAEGLDTKIATGIIFEDETKLNEWVDTFKTLTKPKGVEDYSSEELQNFGKQVLSKLDKETIKKWGDTGDVKTIQSLFDEIRTKSKPKEDLNKSEKFEESEAYKALKDQFDSLSQTLAAQTEKSKKADFESKVEKAAKGLDPLEVEMIKGTLNVDASDDEINKKVEAYRSLLTKRGITGLKPEEANQPKTELPAEMIKDLKDFA